MIAASGWLSYAEWSDALSMSRVLTLALDCPPDVLAERHEARPDRRGDLIHSTTVHDGWTYDRRFDTSATTADDIARELEALAQ